MPQAVIFIISLTDEHLFTKIALDIMSIILVKWVTFQSKLYGVICTGLVYKSIRIASFVFVLQYFLTAVGFLLT